MSPLEFVLAVVDQAYLALVILWTLFQLVLMISEFLRNHPSVLTLLFIVFAVACFFKRSPAKKDDKTIEP